MKAKIVAHRGASFDHPENTFAAFDAACALGVFGMELDLQLSKDEKVLVYHDTFMQKAGRPELKVMDLDWQELKELDVGLWFSENFKGERMPLLTEVLDKYAQQNTLLLEIKADEDEKRNHLLTDLVVQALEEKNLLSEVYILCFDLAVLKMALAKNPACRTVINLESLEAPDPRLLDIVASVAAISMDINKLDDEAADWIREKEKLLMVWTCNSEEEIKKAQIKKADYVMTDKPAFAKIKLT